MARVYNNGNLISSLNIYNSGGRNLYIHNLEISVIKSSESETFKFTLITNFNEALTTANISNLLNNFYSYSYGEIPIHEQTHIAKISTGYPGVITTKKFSFLKGNYPGSSDICFQIKISKLEIDDSKMDQYNNYTIKLDLNGNINATDPSGNDISSEYSINITDTVI